MNTLRPLAGHTSRLVRQWSSLSVGKRYGSDFKQFLTGSDGRIASFWHDVPLNWQHSKCPTFHMVVENPKFSNGKFEIQLSEPGNPIIQDVYKNGQLRFVPNLFPLKGYPINYGAVPQTWESPFHDTHGYPGDNDPLDCCEIGSTVQKMGSVREVKLLGSLALIDDNEMDWKLIVIDTKDPLCDRINNLQDVEHCMPNYLKLIKDWFQNYKIPNGKPVNKFAFNGEYLDTESTIPVIKDCHQSWKDLVSGKFSGMDNVPEINTQLEQISIERGKSDESLPIPQEVNKWYFI